MSEIELKNCPTPLGKLLKKHRIDKGLTLKQFAANLDKPASYLSAIEYGRKNCNNGLLLEMAQVLDLTCGEVVELNKARIASKTTRKCSNCKSLQTKLDKAVSALEIIRKSPIESPIASRIAQQTLLEIKETK